jgi:hypothetical protein
MTTPSNTRADLLVALDRALSKAQPVLNQNEIERLMGALSPGLENRRTVYRRIDQAIANGMFVRVGRGVYMNLRRQTKSTYADAVEYIRPGAIASLQTVLGDAGVIDNFTTDIVTCVVPRPVGKTSVAVPQDNPHFAFHVVAERAAMPDVDFPIFAGSGYRRATPELAFAHWLYIAEQPRGGLTIPSLEIDLAHIDQGKVEELCRAIGIEGAWDKWLAQKTERDADADVQAHGSMRFGF